MRWLAIVALVASCGGSGSKQIEEAPPPTESAAAPAPVPAPEPVEPVEPAEPEKAPEPEGPPPLPAVEGVPVLTAEAAATPPNGKGKKLNKKGLRAHRAGKFDEAIAIYKEGVNADPGYLMVRYNLACVLVTADRPLEGLFLLEQFKQVGCAECIERLVRAREDKEWEPLWGDAQFNEITHVAVESAYVGIAEFWPQFEERKPNKFSAKPAFWIDRTPGFAKLPAYEFVLRNLEGEVSRRRVKTRGVKGWRYDTKPIRLPGAGSYVLELEGEGTVFAASTIAVTNTLCFGGTKGFVSMETPAPKLANNLGDDEYEDGDYAIPVGEKMEEPIGFTINWQVPGVRDGRDYAVIWTRGKKVIQEDTFEIANAWDDDVGCPIGVVEFNLDAPEDLHMQPGRWKVGLYSKFGPSYELRFRLRRRKVVSEAPIRVKRVRKLPKAALALLEESTDMSEEWADEQEGPYGKRVFRGLARSKKLKAAVDEWEALRKANKPRPKKLTDKVRALARKHGGPWKKSELQAWHGRFVTARPVAPAATTRTKETCLATVCPSYPAISPDGKILVTRYYTILTRDEDGCDGIGQMILHTDGAGAKSVDMTGFKTMEQCGDDDISLVDGHKLEVKRDDDGEAIIRILDAKGAEVSKSEHSGAGVSVCAAPGVRAVVVETHESATHCYESPEPFFEVLNY